MGQRYLSRRRTSVARQLVATGLIFTVVGLTGLTTASASARFGDVCHVNQCPYSGSSQTLTFVQDAGNNSQIAGSPKSRGASLTVNIKDLPEGTFTNVQITEPNGITRDLSHGSMLFSNAPPGRWRIFAPTVSVSNNIFYPPAEITTINLGRHARGRFTVDYGEELADSTLVAPPSNVQELSAPDGDGNQNATVVDPTGAITSGSVLASGAGAEDPEGLLLDVTDVTAEDGVDTISGVQGSLTDLGPEGDIDSTKAFPEVDAPTDLNMNNATYGPLSSFLHNLNCSGSASASVSGSVSLTPSVNVSVKWGGVLHPGTITASASLTGTEVANLTAGIEGQASCTFDDELLGNSPIVLGTYDFQVGPVPIVIVPKLNFELEANGSVDGSVKTSVNQSLAVTAGVAWNGSSLTPIHNVSKSINFVPPTATFSGKLHAQVGPNLTFDIEGVAGPFVNADAHTDMTVNPAATPWWTLTAGVEAGGGIKLNVWKFHFDEEDPNILSYTWGLSNSTGPPPSNLGIVTTSLPSATQGSPYSTTLQASGGVGSYSWSITSGSLPAGLNLNSGNGVISGTPSGSGDSSFGVTVTDGIGQSANNSFVLTVAPTGCGSSCCGNNCGGGQSIQIGWSSSYSGWIYITLNGFSPGPYQYSCDFGSGGDESFDMTETTEPETFDNGKTCYDFDPGDTVWVTIGNTQSNTITVP